MDFENLIKKHLFPLLTQKSSVILLLLLAVFFCLLLAVLKAVIGPQWPVVYPVWPVRVAVLLTAGCAVVAFSRWLLSLFANRMGTELLRWGLWMLAEIVVLVVGVSSLMWVLGWGEGLNYPDLLGRVAVSAAVLSIVPYTVTVLVYLLQHRQIEVTGLRNLLRDVERKTEPENEEDIVQLFDRADRLVLATKRSNVLYVEAADNYAHLHYLSAEKEETLFLHNSLKNIYNALASHNIVRCHKSYLVNLSNVRFVRKEGDGLVLEVAHCDRLIPVSKTYSKEVLSQFAR